MKSTTAGIALIALIVGVALGYLLFAPAGADLRGAGHGAGMARDIDAHFIEQMIPHHEGAIAMAKLALERSKREDVRSLAQGIVDAQEGEIAKMQGWYQSWYGRAPMESMGHGGMHMRGMEGDLDELASAPDFDNEFLRQMIVHHEMAIMMAQMLEAGTSRPEMKELADQIITSQTREIQMMTSWLAR